MIYRDFPDVFDPAFAADAVNYAEQLRRFSGDPALIGYFLMNEPNWGFANETPAAGMLAHHALLRHTSRAGQFLRRRYDDAAFQSAWGIAAPLSAVAEGTWRHPLNERATRDLEEFSTIMIERFFGTLSRACKTVDSDHLNLGMRYYTVPPSWAMAGMLGMFDVFSINCYRQQVPPESVAEIAAGLGIPVLVGEWHFGALDVGLPGSGIGRVADQDARGTPIATTSKTPPPSRRASACTGSRCTTNPPLAASTAKTGIPASTMSVSGPTNPSAAPPAAPMSICTASPPVKKPRATTRRNFYRWCLIKVRK